ncbi:MAG: hypothetical protein LBN71_07500, partial [Tannerella sp.]|nr:hypothetical protein [Tannerella sp.]
MLLKQRTLLWSICLFSFVWTGLIQAQENILSADKLTFPGVDAPPDSLLYALTDTIKTDTAAVQAVDTVPRKPGMLEAPVIYQATDSIVMTSNNMAYLFGQGDVKY